MQFKLQCADFRALPIPYTNSSGKDARIGIVYVGVDQLPAELGDWMKVNPRVPRLDRHEHLKGPVAKAIVRTLTEEPEMMCVRNNGITLLVDDMDFHRVEGGHGILTVTLADPDRHGIANGGHTFTAIRQVEDDPDIQKPVNASVRLHLIQGIDRQHIADIAEGLNRSLQVDDKSLENLQGTFDEIKTSLMGKQGADQIAYRQGETGEVDIQFVLTSMAMLDLDEFPDRKRHPHTLFGQPKAVLDKFVEANNRAKKGEKASYKLMLPRLHEILSLTDEIQRGAAEELGRLKISKAKNGNRVASPKHKTEPAYFAGGQIGGHVPLGWLFPMVAAFRANIDSKKWADGEFAWLMEPNELLNATIVEMCSIIRQEHMDNKEKPAEVGRKEAAYRGCYSVTMMELAGRGLL